jgi:ABC-type uncharacterized transport system permease subunit
MLNAKVSNSQIALISIPIAIISSISTSVESLDISHSVHRLDLPQSLNNLIAQNSGTALPPDVSQLS